jgi:predicted molibdopterin-dependent oxidoreductase YjgC
MDYTSVRTTCPYCGVGCNLELQVVADHVVGVLPAKGHPVGEGGLCIKGWNAHAFVHHPERLTKPLVKRMGQFFEVTWDEALGRVSSRLEAIRGKHGPDSIGVLVSAKCTNEENYLLQKFARAVIGTNNVDHCARL